MHLKTHYCLLDPEWENLYISKYFLTEPPILQCLWFESCILFLVIRFITKNCIVSSLLVPRPFESQEGRQTTDIEKVGIAFIFYQL